MTEKTIRDFEHFFLKCSLYCFLQTLHSHFCKEWNITSCDLFMHSLWKQSNPLLALRAWSSNLTRFVYTNIIKENWVTDPASWSWYGIIPDFVKKQNVLGLNVSWVFSTFNCNCLPAVPYTVEWTYPSTFAQCGCSNSLAVVPQLPRVLMSAWYPSERPGPNRTELVPIHHRLGLRQP